MRHHRKSEPQSVQGNGVQGKAQNNQTGNECAMPATASSNIDAWIRRLGQELILAYQGGDRETACHFQSAMFMAIRQRHPAQQHSRFMEIDAAIWGQS